MYIVTIINDSEETIINYPNIGDISQRITGTISLGINTIDSFEFVIYPQNQGYDKIYPYKTMVKAYNTKTDKYDFIGRVLMPTGSMDEEGRVYKSFVCESELGYLCDSCLMYGEYHDISIKDYLKVMIDAHNLLVEPSKAFQIGEVTVKDNNDSIYKYTAYDTTWQNINDDLIDSFGGEIKLRYDNGIKYIDYMPNIGEVCTTEIRLGKNIKSINNETDPTQFYTRLIPVGAKLNDDTDERLTISTVNNDKVYIDDQDAINELGIIVGIVVWDDVTLPQNLLTKGKQYLANQRISVSNTITALDLSLIGIDIDSFEVGNYYPLIHEMLGIDTQTRIISKNIIIENPELSSIVLGEKAIDIKDYQLSAAKQNKKLNNISYTLNNTVRSLNNFETATNNEISVINEDVAQIRAYAGDMADISKLLKMHIMEV